MKIIFEQRYRGVYISFPYWYEKPIQKLFLPLTTIRKGRDGVRDMESNYTRELAGLLAADYFNNEWPTIDTTDIEYSVALWHESDLQKKHADKRRKKLKGYFNIKESLTNSNAYANQCPHCYNDAAISDGWVNLNGGLAFRCLVCSGDFVRRVHEFTLEQEYALCEGKQFDYREGGTDRKRCHPVPLSFVNICAALINLF